ncbi:unnamed protein product [Rhodiola kirilowii]
MALPGLSPFSNGDGGAAGLASPSAAVLAEEDPDKKIRKPYTITKSRQSWTEPEHDKFLEALQLFDRDWKKIEAFIGSKTVIQIRSHAQKYFLKVQKSGGNEHLPPPRPKRKAAHPYPHKASKSVPLLPQAMGRLQSSAPVSTSSLPQPGYVLKHDVSSIPADPIGNAAASSSWTDNSAHASASPNASRGFLKSAAETTAKNPCSSAESTPRVQSVSRAPVQANKTQSVRVLPDFAQVYGFIGSVFDPNASGHLQNLKQMDPIDVETVLLLMRNLSINLTSPAFEDHRKLLSDQ